MYSLIEQFLALAMSRGLRGHPIFPCDFCLCGYLKSCVHESKLHTLEEFKTAIRNRIEEINEKTLGRVEANFREWLEICVRENGQHLNGINFRT